MKPLRIRNVIGLIGKAGSGKDTVASFLPNYVRCSFGDLVKVEVNNALKGVWPNEWNSEIDKIEVLRPKLGDLTRALHVCTQRNESAFKKPTSAEMRTILQIWGTEFRRGQSPDYWVSQMRASLFSSFDRPQEAETDIVFTDVRFRNEAALIKELGGELWRIKRFDIPRTHADDHQSETEQDTLTADRILWNTGTLEELQNLVAIKMDIQKGN